MGCGPKLGHARRFGACNREADATDSQLVVRAAIPTAQATSEAAGLSAASAVSAELSDWAQRPPCIDECDARHATVQWLHACIPHRDWALTADFEGAVLGGEKASSPVLLAAVRTPPHPTTLCTIRAPHLTVARPVRLPGGGLVPTVVVDDAVVAQAEQVNEAAGGEDERYQCEHEAHVVEGAHVVGGGMGGGTDGGSGGDGKGDCGGSCDGDGGVDGVSAGGGDGSGGGVKSGSAAAVRESRGRPCGPRCRRRCRR